MDTKISSGSVHVCFHFETNGSTSSVPFTSVAVRAAGECGSEGGVQLLMQTSNMHLEDRRGRCLSWVFGNRILAQITSLAGSTGQCSETQWKQTGCGARETKEALIRTISCLVISALIREISCKAVIDCCRFLCVDC
ncbi:hypothetical protein J6590_035504 [Homalodisca vitripennis]|nr:hypothetical protein J6590_035504 [Homalodisca vitripennis]